MHSIHTISGIAIKSISDDGFDATLEHIRDNSNICMNTIPNILAAMFGALPSFYYGFIMLCLVVVVGWS